MVSVKFMVRVGVRDGVRLRIGVRVRKKTSRNWEGNGIWGY